ncbi:helix-turn-helix protein [Dyadobacter jejuensis]|uniref:Helix-turn-helix protein n=2 Tax=Dyadobacter jejuensis TaxID=1082580 RepID=A0A315ZZY1_9BACT|nr:helix-turn-helix transcriptional regulator [Dyadobacter jejuensis]PWJ51226.1 helix-turn-helix protein [Dyadobacter jejuensis]
MKNIATVITALRKEKGWSQTDLARESSISREILGKYERGEAAPSIDFAKRIADALGVTLDYLVGEGQSASLDKKNVQRLQAIEQLPEDEKKTVFALLDAFIRDFRAKQQYAV